MRCAVVEGCTDAELVTDLLNSGVTRVVVEPSTLPSLAGLPSDRLGVRLPFADAEALCAAICKHAAEASNVTVSPISPIHSFCIQCLSLFARALFLFFSMCSASILLSSRLSSNPVSFFVHFES